MSYSKHLHLISFNVPYPANYGGVIDVFYKLKALSECGIKVHLHSFQYGRGREEELKKYCYKVHYYKRNIYRDPLFGKLPYIVASRNSAELLYNLLKDDHPILFEGIHCCYLLDHPELENRFKVVRMHNIEHLYYKNLSKIEKNVFKKYFFSVESTKLRKFEKKLEHASAIAAISPDDAKVLGLRFKNVFYLPVFHSNSVLECTSGYGEFALYHGNLGVGENNEAALYLVTEVFNKIKYPLIIAGNNPSKELQKAVEGNNNITLIHKIDTRRINQLIRNAHMNVLPTFQNTGMKLKLINALFQGRHCVVNRKMVHNTGLESLCVMANTPEKMQESILQFAQKPFTNESVNDRRRFLEEYFNNERNALDLAERINIIPVRAVSGSLL